jgi:hypothetical protein
VSAPPRCTAARRRSGGRRCTSARSPAPAAPARFPAPVAGAHRPTAPAPMSAVKCVCRAEIWQGMRLGRLLGPCSNSILRLVVARRARLDGAGGAAAHAAGPRQQQALLLSLEQDVPAGSTATQFTRCVAPTSMRTTATCRLLTVRTPPCCEGAAALALQDRRVTCPRAPPPRPPGRPRGCGCARCASPPRRGTAPPQSRSRAARRCGRPGRPATSKHTTCTACSAAGSRVHDVGQKSQTGCRGKAATLWHASNAVNLILRHRIGLLLGHDPVGLPVNLTNLSDDSNFMMCQ